MRTSGARNYRELRVWDSARALKNSLYALTNTPSFQAEERLYKQLREAAASAASHIAEGYGRFEPLDHARFLKMGKASLIECQNHLIDAMDRGLITDRTREEHDAMIRGLLNGLGGLIAYLQSPEAKKNVEQIKRRRIARRSRN
jgi:four helix bundle protein